ncbi:protein a6 [Drosophila innubila]|uniref:protein a6 n=1 Tax=Drosophila innubila TaxID=198719 RepID=UPI00148E5479|nr:protein a6 [Drosophila innubila]XP_034480574.1 protein a6 [Drosophila innubila]
MNTKHSEPFYISGSLFDNRRLKRRLDRWLERQRQQQLQQQQQQLQQQQLYMTHLGTFKGRRRCHLMLSRRHVAATLPADITIDLLSDEEEQEQEKREKEQQEQRKRERQLFNAHLQLSTVPNITLVPVELAHHSANFNSSMLLSCSNYGQVTSTTTTTATVNDSIVLTSDEEQDLHCQSLFNRRSPPPLAPLTFSDSLEEVTVSLVPRHATTANCQQRQRRRQRGNNHNNNNTPITTTNVNNVDSEFSDLNSALPDETTVHTVIANRIYELSLSKLREGLASSGVPEYAQDLLPEQLQKLSPAMRAKVAPLVAPSPPAPISLKLSSDLSISLISDDDDCCEAGGNTGSASGNGNNSASNNSELLHPVLAAAEAHAAAKLLKQQQPQLSVVQHLQYPGHHTPVSVAVSLPVMADRAPTLLPSTRRRKLG